MIERFEPRQDKPKTVSAQAKERPRLLSWLSGRPPVVEKGKETRETQQEQMRRNREDMQISSEWDERLRTRYAEKHEGQELPENQNTAYATVTEFREHVTRFQTLRANLPLLNKRLIALDDERLLLLSKQGDDAKATEQYRYLETEMASIRRSIPDLQRKAGELWKEIQSLNGPDVDDADKIGFEATYRLYMRERVKFYQFIAGLDELQKLRRAWSRPISPFIPGADVRDVNSDGKKIHQEGVPSKAAKSSSLMARLLRDSSGRKIQEEGLATMSEEEKALQQMLYGNDAAEFADRLGKISGEVAADKTLSKSWAGGDERVRTLAPAAIAERINELHAHLYELWNETGGYIEGFYREREVDKLLAANHRREEVFETPSVLKIYNTLLEWERDHQNTTIGGVFVGEPGVGKTTNIRHYLENVPRDLDNPDGPRGRDYVYIDLSADVTRFTLFGSKSLELGDSVAEYQRLAADLKRMDATELVEFVREHSKRIMEVYQVTEDDAAALFLAQAEESIKEHVPGAAVDVSLSAQIELARKGIVETVKGAERREMADKFMHIAKHNGWRDGVMISAVRSGKSIICDEFNKMRNWDLMHSLMTAKPGEKWYFADNNEWISVPKNWRMYFTANIDATSVPEALASRAAGKVMKVPNPPHDEEFLIADVFFASVDGIFMRSAEDRGKLKTLINNIHPNIRNATAKQQKGVIPVSLRLLRTLSEKLVRREDLGNQRVEYIATDKSFDEALFETYIDSYQLYKDFSNAKLILGFMTKAGLLLDPKLDSKVKELLGDGTPEYLEYVKSREAHEKDDSSSRLAELGRQMGGTADFAFNPF